MTGPVGGVGQWEDSMSYTGPSMVLFLLCYQYLLMELIIICTFKYLEIVNKYRSMSVCLYVYDKYAETIVI